MAYMGHSLVMVHAIYRSQRLSYLLRDMQADDILKAPSAKLRRSTSLGSQFVDIVLSPRQTNIVKPAASSLWN